MNIALCHLHYSKKDQSIVVAGSLAGSLFRRAGRALTNEEIVQHKLREGIHFTRSGEPVGMQAARAQAVVQSPNTPTIMLEEESDNESEEEDL